MKQGIGRRQIGSYAESLKKKWERNSNCVGRVKFCSFSVFRKNESKMFKDSCVSYQSLKVGSWNGCEQ